MRDPRFLPGDLHEMQSDIGSKLEEGRKIDRDLLKAADLFAELKPANLPRAEREVVAAASLHHWRRERSTLEKPFATNLSDADQLKLIDGLEYVFIFHRVGRLREAALRKLSVAAPAPRPGLRDLRTEPR